MAPVTNIVAPILSLLYPGRFARLSSERFKKEIAVIAPPTDNKNDFKMSYFLQNEEKNWLLLLIRSEMSSSVAMKMYNAVE